LSYIPKVGYQNFYNGTVPKVLDILLEQRRENTTIQDAMVFP
jgi:hypothetical protein